MTDMIGDMLTRIRNAQRARKERVEMPFSKVRVAIARILEVNGYLGSFAVDGEGAKAVLTIALLYRDHGREPVIRSLARESTPGHRVYRGAEELPRVLNDYGIAIISTSEGLMTNKEARKKGIGGEVICSVY